MEYNACPLYKLKSKKYLKQLLHIDNKFFKQEYISTLIFPYIDKSGKPRLIEPPSEELKRIQKRIKHFLSLIEVPNNVFSGIKGRSYSDNAKQHIGEKCRNLYKIDFSAFFPSISRECVYRFFLDDLMCSPDIANILTNLTTIDLEQSKAKDIDDIYSFLKGKNCFCTNHLISGAPTSQILSYLANHCMFDEMQKLASQNHAQMTVYVDDVTFSGECWISHSFRQEILNLVKKYGYQISRNKVKLYTKSYPKLVTGVIISPDGKAIVKNSMRERIIKEFEHLHRNPTDFQSRQRLCGLLT